MRPQGADKKHRNTNSKIYQVSRNAMKKICNSNDNKKDRGGLGVWFRPVILVT
jgi:hypothetical protein